MKELFEVIGALDADAANMVCTVLEGNCAGEKAVYTDGERIWESSPDGFFHDIPRLSGKCTDTGHLLLKQCELFCESIGRPMEIVICGGGHVSIPVIQIGVMMGWHVTVLEDRPRYADNARRAGASEVICMPFTEGLAKISGNADTYFVILTRGHRYDKECLKEIVTKLHAYIGMIGSRRRSAMVKQSLIDEGCDKEVLEQVASPIGLNIGAQTPEEIGVAIIAEIISVKNQRRRTDGYPAEIIEGVLSAEYAEYRKVLATIVRRQGSAPREAGAKMLVLEDGRTIGTVGGGCAEAEICRTALLMMKNETKGCRLCEVDMTAAEAEEEGMICGGRITVLLEVV